MKFITVRDLRTKPASIWRKLKIDNELIITNNGKPIALLTPLSDNNFDETIRAIRKSKAIQALQSMQKKSIEAGNDKMKMNNIDNEIKQYRKSNNDESSN